MASLTRGISFRRQGSSGLSWADTWTFNDEGVLVRTTREDAHMHQQQRFGGSSLARVHESHDNDDEDAEHGVKFGVQQKVDGAKDVKKKAESSSVLPSPASLLGLRRSKSVGSATTARSVTTPGTVASAPCATRASQNTASRILKWLKKTFGKRKNGT